MLQKTTLMKTRKFILLSSASVLWPGGVIAALASTGTESAKINRVFLAAKRRCESASYIITRESSNRWLGATKFQTPGSQWICRASLGMLLKEIPAENRKSVVCRLGVASTAENQFDPKRLALQISGELLAVPFHQVFIHQCWSMGDVLLLSSEWA